MFACKRNSCRSQMAEGFARSLGAGSFEVVSAGLESSIVNSTAVEESISNRGLGKSGVVHLIGWPRHGTRLPEAHCDHVWILGDPPDALAALSRTIRRQRKFSRRPRSPRFEMLSKFLTSIRRGRTCVRIRHLSGRSHFGYSVVRKTN